MVVVMVDSKADRLVAGTAVMMVSKKVDEKAEEMVVWMVVVTEGRWVEYLVASMVRLKVAAKVVQMDEKMAAK